MLQSERNRPGAQPRLTNSTNRSPPANGKSRLPPGSQEPKFGNRWRGIRDRAIMTVNVLKRVAFVKLEIPMANPRSQRKKPQGIRAYRRRVVFSPNQRQNRVEKMPRDFWAVSNARVGGEGLRPSPGARSSWPAAGKRVIRRWVRRALAWQAFPSPCSPLRPGNRLEERSGARQ